MAQFPHLWMQRVCSGVVPYVLELYTENAVLVPTYNREVLQGKPRLAAYFREFMHDPKKKDFCGKVDSVIFQQYGNVCVFSGTYTFSWKGGRGPRGSVQARYTFVLIPDSSPGKRAIGWKILTHHSSESPK